MDRRRHARQSLRYPVEYAVLGEGQDLAPVASETVDVSEGGLGIRTRTAFDPGTELSLELCPDPRQRPVLALARVIFSRPAEPDFVTGVEVIWVDGGALGPDASMRPQALWSFL